MQLKFNLNYYIYNIISSISCSYIYHKSYHVSKQRQARAAYILNKKAKQMVNISMIIIAVLYLTIFYDLLLGKQNIIAENCKTTLE